LTKMQLNIIELITDNQQRLLKSVLILGGQQRL